MVVFVVYKDGDIAEFKNIDNISETEDYLYIDTVDTSISLVREDIEKLICKM